MVRPLVFALAVLALALGVPAARTSRSVGPRPGTLLETSGVVAVSGGSVPFTLYRHSASTSERPLLILAAEDGARHPLPFRLLAEAAALAGVSAVYLEPSAAPAEAATRLKAVLRRQGLLGLGGTHVWSWAEGNGCTSPTKAPPRAPSVLSTVANALHRDFFGRALVQRARDWTSGSGTGCSLLLRH